VPGVIVFKFDIMENFKEIINGERPVLIDFYADWCGPCRLQAPILDELKKIVGERVAIVKVNIDKSEDLAMEYRVRSVPTLILFKNGQQLWRASGLQTLDTLSEQIQAMT
jgi:thioredoxin 1